MNEEMMFTVCNVPKFLEEQMRKVKDISNMNEDNMKGYEYAVETMLSILKQTIHALEMDGEIFVHSDKINPEHELEEFDLHELLELCGCRVVAQFNNKGEME